ncbi:MAG: dihydroneopterin aldolase [Bacteroidota bacterium]|jgi:dihydroneopterin aldolase|nr:dihydroneopterin aldolase [Bacteroidota bacterium]
MGIVSLEGLEFFAYHGYYDEEQKVGNKYAVDISVHIDFDKAAENDVLSGTVNYEILYKIINREMKKPSRMLENLGKRIIHSAFAAFPAITFVEISISKFNPPIGGVCQRARIQLREERLSHKE